MELRVATEAVESGVGVEGNSPMSVVCESEKSSEWVELEDSSERWRRVNDGPRKY